MDEQETPKTIKLTVLTNIESKNTGPVLWAEEIELLASAVVSRSKTKKINLEDFMRKK